MPENAVYVGRPSMWGNNYPLGGIDHKTGTPITTRDQAIALFKERQCGELMRQDARACLAGADLACWCPLDQPCHADVLLEIANSELTS
jgi:hypothetical protein